MSPKRVHVMAAWCPECDSRILFANDPEFGQRVICMECRAQLEVVHVEPLELYWSLDDYDHEFQYNDYEEVDEEAFDDDYADIPSQKNGRWGDG